MPEFYACLGRGCEQRKVGAILASFNEEFAGVVINVKACLEKNGFFLW